MIDNFDQLVERCTAKRRKFMIRISLWISGAVLIAVAITAILIQWLNEPNLPKASEPISPPKCTETTKSEDSNRRSSSLPPQDFSKNRAYVVQLASSKSFDEVNATRRRLPERYRSSLAIYYINGFYALRYIDIYDRESIPKILAYFHAEGFPSATVYEYNPDRIAITSAIKPSRASSTAKPESSPPSNDVPIPITLPSLPAQSAVVKTVPASRLLNVQSSFKNTTQDFINQYNTNPKYETALAVARSFYTKENFVNAAFWAKKANQINREGEEAWLLYAKSTYAQGHTADAIAILELYLNYKDSKAATELIKTWR